MGNKEKLKLGKERLDQHHHMIKWQLQEKFTDLLAPGTGFYQLTEFLFSTVLKLSD